MMALIEGHTNEELFSRGHYDWTGTPTLGSYFISATSSHYIWGRTTLRAMTRHL